MSDEMKAALLEWVAAREAIFADPLASGEVWVRLGNAEHALMTLGRALASAT